MKVSILLLFLNHRLLEKLLVSFCRLAGQRAQGIRPWTKYFVQNFIFLFTKNSAT